MINSKIDVSMATEVQVFEIFSTKVSYFTMLYVLTKNECFFHLSVEVAKMGLSDKYNLFCGHIFYIFNI